MPSEQSCPYADNDITPAELAELYKEAILEDDRKRRAAFEEVADERMLSFYPESGLYTENGKAINEYGEYI